MTAVVCLIAARGLRPNTGSPSSVRRTPSPPVSGEERNREARFWLVFAVLLAFLGLNKQADFQSLLTLYGRDILRSLDLYDVRRTIQATFIAGVAMVASVSVVFCLWIVRRLQWPCQMATAGLTLQFAFVVIRAASFHHVDTLLGLQLGNLKLNLLFESVGLLAILLAATLCLLKVRTKERT